MFELMVAALSFAGLHMCVAGTGLRDVLIGSLGAGPYRAVFALTSMFDLWWICKAYPRAYAQDNVSYWSLPHAQDVAGPIMALAVFLVVGGLTTKSPVAIGDLGMLLREPEPRGMLRITRHPFLWGVMLWSSFHLAANGNAASIVLFSTFLSVAAWGSRSIDKRRERVLGKMWLQYRLQTSTIPFHALATRRTHFVFSEIGVWRVALAVAVFCALVSVHPTLFQASPLPGVGQ